MKNSYFLPQINHSLEQTQVDFQKLRAKDENVKIFGNRVNSTPRSTRISQTTQASNGTFDLTISRNSSDPFLINYNNQQNRMQNVLDGKYKLLHMRSQLSNVLSVSKDPISRSTLKRSFHYKPVINQSKRSSLINIDINDQNENQKDQFEDLHLKKKMLETFTVEPKDKQVVKQRGKKSIEEYYKHYKSLDRTIQQNQHFKIENSCVTNMLNESQKHFVLPSKVGIFKKEKADQDILKLQQIIKFDRKFQLINQIKLIRNMRYGDKYAKLISSGIGGYKNINQFQLSNNRITSKSSNDLIQSIMKNAKIINISNNRIGKPGCDQISLQISQKQCKQTFYSFFNQNPINKSLNIF